MVGKKFNVKYSVVREVHYKALVVLLFKYIDYFLEFSVYKLIENFVLNETSTWNPYNLRTFVASFVDC
jgi:hypothetical protein